MGTEWDHLGASGRTATLPKAFCGVFSKVVKPLIRGGRLYLQVTHYTYGSSGVNKLVLWHHLGKHATLPYTGGGKD